MTSNKTTESAVETLSIERLGSLGYAYLHGSLIGHDGDSPERTGYGDVILDARLRKAVEQINPGVSAGDRDSAIKEVLRIRTPELLVDNEAFHRLLTEGVPVSTHKDGDELTSGAIGFG